MKLVIGQKYKVRATPREDEEYQFSSIEVNGSPIPSNDIEMEGNVGTYTFTMNSSINAISATFTKCGGGKQEVDVNTDPEGCRVEVESAK